MMMGSQQLRRTLKDRDRQITELESENHELKESIAVLDGQLLDKPFVEHIAELQKRITELEQALSSHHERGLAMGDVSIMEHDPDGDGLTVRDVPGSEYNRSELRKQTETLLMER